MSPTSLTLLEKVRQNNRGAWERLVSLYSPLVYHWCRLAGLQQADTEEVGQEVFLAVLKGLAKFRHDEEGATFRGWLRAVTRSKIYDHRSPLGGTGVGGSSVQQQLAAVAEVTVEEDEHSVSVEKNILYRRAIELIEESFEPSTRQAFWRLLAGQKAQEVAAELRMSPNAVYTAKSRILTRLRHEFGDVLDLGRAGRAGLPSQG